MTNHCTQHLPCRIRAARGLHGRTTEKTEPATGRIWGSWTHGETTVVLLDGDEIGRVRVETMQCHDGRLLTQWNVFSGGEHIGQYADEIVAHRALRGHCEASSFRWTLALHG